MSTTHETAEYHVRAATKHEKTAASHDRAAEEHRSAAKLHVAGDYAKAGEHALNAESIGRQAQDLGVRAMERQGYENDQFGVNAKKMYLHRRHSP